MANLTGGTVAVAETSATYSDFTATLTEAGAGVFGGFYQPGAELDPVNATGVGTSLVVHRARTALDSKTERV